MKKLSLAVLFAAALGFAGLHALADDKPENPWRGLAVNSVIEMETVMHMEKPSKMEQKSSQTWTVIKKDDKQVTIRMEMVSNGAKIPATEFPIPLEAPKSDGKAAEGPKPQDLGKEKVKTPAGEFECNHTKVESKQGDMVSTTESWTAKECPLPIKSITKVSGSSMEQTTTTIVTKFEKK